MKKFDSLARFLKKIRVPYAVIFVIIGLLTTAWFLIRVIPKPARAGYPCMRVAAPFMSSFVLYLISLATTAFAFKKARAYFGKSKHAVAGICLAVAVVTAFAVNFIDIKPTQAGQPSADKTDFPANEPMGIGKGINPGRVVWAHDLDATNQAFTPSDTKFFWEKGVINQEVVSRMLQNTIMQLTGDGDLKEAWNALFKYHNKRKKGTDTGYKSGEAIFIKINQGCTWALNGYPYDPATQSKGWGGIGVTEATPQFVLELLYQLVEVAGVPQENIYIGDPGKYIYKHNMDVWGAAYPYVNYICEEADGGLFQKSSPTNDPVFNYSDNGVVMPDAEPYTYYEVTDADYLINVANLKMHLRAGVSLTAKNHFGTQRQRSDIGATNLHPGTLQGDIAANNLGWGKYRVLVDLMGNEFMGDNTMLFLVDGLTGGGAHENKPPVKYVSDIFNVEGHAGGDWANSIFASQDEVALESVCQDILRAEWDGKNKHSSENNENENAPWWEGVDDHLHQAADPANWPAEIERRDSKGKVIEMVLFEGYFPNLDSDEPIKSLGVHEHWNNATDRKYSRNLNPKEGKGIELVMAEAPELPISSSEYTAYKIKEEHLPKIDALEDSIWLSAKWYAIDQTWLPYNNIANSNDPDKNHKVHDGSSDFNGKFKLLWSEDKNVIYMLAEIYDDVFIDGYISGGDYPNFDVLEIFLDENKSKGNHLFNTGSTKASNAFAYHLMVTALADGEAQTEFKAMDLVGTDWGNSWNPDYSDHFEGFAMRRRGNNTSVYEFALRVYSDQYNIGTKDASGTAAENESCIVTLVDEKVLGFTVAYCDNDAKDNSRDHFFGSAPVSQANRNASWENADPFGSLTLSATFIEPPIVKDPGIGVEDNTTVAKNDKIAFIYPNPATDFINLTIVESYKGQVKADLYTISGALVSNLYKGEASANLQLPLSGLASGTYICVITTAKGSEAIRIVVK